MKTAVLGFGTVGAGIYEMLQRAEGLEAGPVYVRKGKADTPWKTDDFDQILADPSVEAVAEAMGGLDPAFSLAERTLASGKHFVTANKMLVAEYGVRLQEIAERSGAAFLFSAACGGGVPLLHNLALARQADEIVSVQGILNGTTNYMLDQMQSASGGSYESALQKAQSLGYAEAEPKADVSGLDALRKIRLAAAVAFGLLPADGFSEGIENVTAEDIRFYQSRGLILRLIAKTARTEEGVSAYVEPVLFGKDAPEAAVQKNYNLASYEGRASGLISFQGQGAGRYPTASAVIRDLESIRCGARRMFPEGTVKGSADSPGSCSRYFVRTEQAFAALFPGAERLAEENDCVRLKTAPFFAKTMHSLVQTIREEGGRVMFAALDPLAEPEDYSC